VGLTPTVDEHSIKVEGTGSAIISDITVELLPNRDIFQDIYPDADDDKSNDESEDDDDDDDEESEVKESQEMKAVKKQLAVLRDEQKQAKEKISSAESRLRFLDSYGKMLDRKRNVDIDEGIEKYRSEREKVFQDHMAGTVRERELAEEIRELFMEEQRLVRLKVKEQHKAAKAKAKAKKAKDKEKEKVQRREAEKNKEKTRIRREREKFWPRQCYTVRITLEAANFTPMSSRRNSVASSAEVVKVAPEKEPSSPGGPGDAGAPTCDISLSYVTSSAFWSPTYDLQLSTTSSTAMLCFDARLTNTTSETWNNCKVILSTSQTTFSGLSDDIPTLVPWRVKLSRGRGNDGILSSREEISYKGANQVQQNAWIAQKPRVQLFGIGPPDNAPLPKPNMDMLPYPPPPQMQVQQQSLELQQVQMLPPAGGFGAGYGLRSFDGINVRKAEVSHRSSAAFGASNAPAPSRAGGLFGSTVSKKKESKRAAGRGGAEEEDEEDAGFDFDSFARGGGDGGGGDDATILPEPAQELEFQESSFEETGMTTTYDLPGLKTLVPSSTQSKQRVARISFAGVAFSHTVVAKYKPAAYLKAKLRNASSVTLLKGEVGLTLDGSFMGRSSLPRCSAGDNFTISLGIDPAIKVAYPKPDVRRATTGMFSKEDSSVYKRHITIANTRAKAGKPVTLVVLDQAPVSEDEKLRIDILQPRGMTVGGAAIPAGASPKDEKDWGKATASLKKAGEISWNVTLNAGKTVKLPLEYEVSVPSGDGVVQC